MVFFENEKCHINTRDPGCFLKIQYVATCAIHSCMATIKGVVAFR